MRGQTPSGLNDTDVSGVGVTIWGCTLVVEVRRGLESVAPGHMWIYYFFILNNDQSLCEV